MTTTNTHTSTNISPQRPSGLSVGEIITHILANQRFQIATVLFVLIAAFSIARPESFAQLANFRQIILNASVLGVIGVGMTFVITTSGIDLSAGAVLVFSSVVSAIVMRDLGGQGWDVGLIGIVVAIACGLGWGIVNGVLIAYAKVPPLIVTLGTMGMALGTALIMTDGVDIREVPDAVAVGIGYGNIFGHVPILSVISLIICAVGGTVLAYTRFGRHVKAIGSNELAARRVGVKVNRQLVKVYAVAGGLYGCAGILSLSYFGTTAVGGNNTTVLDVVAAVVIGGTSLFGGVGSVLGTVIGLFIPAVLQNGFIITGVPPFWQQVAVGGVLIVAVYFDQARRAAATRGSSDEKWKILKLLLKSGRA
ncbi:permease component of ribose/xylose/arabinose/galactoside ABC-type transporter [Rhizobium leguminosarum bv. trifolii WSM2012]|nr:permease component of ribose/xylose/arabinose/galactoside ABC-type transporter [Rhizobium leguminosarum bv. trifolii WSM2012]EJC76919.1 permease component of ribose/xylose/arabinose/galactoside ABC-type transporter [Rhizobium leguminosarum bv. trifolii WSM2012]